MQHALSSRLGGNTTDPKFDIGRILAGAGAIALHVVVLLLLLVPMQAPPLAPEPVRLPDVQWIPRVQPVEPIPVPVEQPSTRVEPAPAISPPIAVEPAALAVVSTQPGDIAVPAVASTANTDVIEAPAATPSVLSGAALRYAVAPPPPYPVRALRAGREGTVLLEVLVDTDGQPLEVTIARSSGHRDLDRAAMKHVMANWRFQPALRDGVAVQAIGRVPIGFQLRR